MGGGGEEGGGGGEGAVCPRHLHPSPHAPPATRRPPVAPTATLPRLPPAPRLLRCTVSDTRRYPSGGQVSPCPPPARVAPPIPLTLTTFKTSGSDWSRNPGEPFRQTQRARFSCLIAVISNSKNSYHIPVGGTAPRIRPCSRGAVSATEHCSRGFAPLYAYTSSLKAYV